MKVIAVSGLHHSGKTTTVTTLVKELKAKGYTVGTIKDIHFEGFSLDRPGSNTHKHAASGADMVTARGISETDILIPRRMGFDDILYYYNHDWALIEGAQDYPAPRIVCAADEDGIEARLDPLTFCIAGPVAESISVYKGIPVINPLTSPSTLVDLVESRVYDRLPDFDAECCGRCGMSCRDFGAAVLSGERRREECVMDSKAVTLMIDGQELPLVPFVQQFIAGSVVGMAKTLRGYRQGSRIELTIKPEACLDRTRRSDVLE